MGKRDQSINLAQGTNRPNFALVRHRLYLNPNNAIKINKMFISVLNMTCKEKHF